MMRERVEWSPMVEAADWLVARLHGLGRDIGSLVPDAYESYARILHPAWLESSEASVKVRWAALAGEAGINLTGTTSFSQMEHAMAPTVRPPDQGTLAPDELSALVEILTGHTTRPQLCWFGVWDGFGWMSGAPAVASLHPQFLAAGGGESAALAVVEPPSARVRLPGRTFALYQGGIGDAADLCREPLWQSPNLWWPDDRAWVVSSDIDLHSSYVAGSRGLAQTLRADARLEVLEVSVDGPIAD